MKFLTRLYLIVFFSGLIMAQGDPSVSSLMRFEEASVDLSNGIPDVSVPFVNLPTRSKDVSVDISLKYHPLNGISADAQAGDCGLGWNLFAGGVISRTIIGLNDASTYYYAASSPNNILNDDVYQFNFMGYFGRFILKQKLDGTLGIKILKQKNSKLDLTFQYNSHFEITSFTFFDEKGNRYLFNIINNSKYTNNAYYLSSIIDNNNKELAHFTYQTCFIPAVANVSPSISFNKLIEINSNGFGKITLAYLNIGINCTNARLTDLTLSDTKNNVIKKMKLFGTQYKIGKIQIADLTETKKETYQFYYDVFDNGDIFDMFGYKGYRPCGLLNYSIGIPSSTKCKSGVLIKMKLPTGGSIVYDYESNAYSKYNKEADNTWHLDLNPNSYYDNLSGLNGINGNFPLIPENFTPNYYSSGPFPFNFSNATTTYNFTVTGTENKTLYFNIIGQPYILPHVSHSSPDNENSGQTIYNPIFTLIRSSSTYNFLNSYVAGSYIDNKSGLCLGQKIELSPGNYTVTISSVNNQYNFGTLEIKSVELNPNPRKWYYGGGVRIKQIGFFDNDAPSNYYDANYTASYNNLGYSPVKEKKFNYNFFSTTNSSGYLVNSDFNIINQDNDLLMYSKLYFGGYKNVTVTDSQNNGKEEYVFKDGLDPIDTTIPNGLTIFENTKRGLLLNKKTYDNNGVLLKSINFNYDFSDPETDGGVSTAYPFVTSSYPPNYPTVAAPILEIGKLTQKTTTNYFGSQAKSVTEYFSYDLTNFQLIRHTAINSLGETLKTEYIYDTNNSPFSQNRIFEPSQTKTYRAGNLLLTNKVNYSSNLFGNQSYLPQTIEYARSTGGLEIQKRFNQYDDFSNLLEEQQENGIVTSYIWGYNNTVIVAKLDNMSYSSIPYSLIAAIQSATDSTTTTETDVLNALNGLRTSTNVNLIKAMITTYTYRPLVGISTVIDVKGDKIFYEYDELGRLIRVRDKDSNILSETQYNLTNQN